MLTCRFHTVNHESNMIKLKPTLQKNDHLIYIVWKSNTFVWLWEFGGGAFLLSVKESVNSFCFFLSPCGHLLTTSRRRTAAAFVCLWCLSLGGVRALTASLYKSVSYSLDVKCNQTAHSESNLHLTQFLQQHVPALLRSLFCPLSIRSVDLSDGKKHQTSNLEKKSFA